MKKNDILEWHEPEQDRYHGLQNVSIDGGGVNQNPHMAGYSGNRGLHAVEEPVKKAGGIHYIPGYKGHMPNIKNVNLGESMSSSIRNNHKPWSKTDVDGIRNTAMINEEQYLAKKQMMMRKQGMD